jgi:large-conductance mechanosensitive channel
MGLNRTDRARTAVIAVGVLLGLAAFEVISSFVRAILGPLIAVFIGESRFEMNEFTIKGSEFQYGFLLEAVLLAAVAALIAFLVLRKYR